MDDTARRIAALSPKQRSLLEARLTKRRPVNDGTPEVRWSPLSFAQTRIWNLVHDDQSSEFFTVTRRFRLPELVDLEVVQAALTLVFERHEALHTEIVLRDGEPVQTASAALSCRLETVTAGGDANAAIATAVRGVCALEAPYLRVLAIVEPGRAIELVMVAHALVCDAPSLAIVRQELLAACNALSRHITPDLPDVLVQATEHARKQRQRLRGVRLEQLLSSYRTLEHTPTLLALHTDRPRVPHRLPRVARYSWVPEVATVERGRHAIGITDLGAAAFWTAVTSILLSRFAGQTSVVLGVQHRRLKSTRPDFVGVATSTMPLAVDLDAHPTCRALVEKVGADMIAWHGQEELPYEKLIEELRIRHSGRHNPLFQVVLAVRSELEASPQGQELPDDEWFSSGSVLFDLALAIDDTRAAPRLALLFDSHVFEEDAIRVFGNAIDGILSLVAQCPDVPVSSLPLLREHDAPADSNSPPHVAPAFAATIHGIYERRAGLSPDGIALEGKESLTYRDLNARANQLARALIARGVQRGEMVGACMGRSAELVLAFLAILKAGAVYLPLDPQYPPDRLAFMIADSQVKVILARDTVLPDVLPASCSIVDITNLDYSRYATPELNLNIESHEPAYVIYTSGSTGKPKGVCVQHAGVCHVADAQIHYLGVTSDDRILQFSSPSFDASIFEFVMAPRSGATLDLAEAEELMPGPPLLELLVARRISVLTIPPSTLAMLPPIELPDLRIIVAAGEACAAEHVARWAPGRHFFNAYGPTEASIWATVAECTAGDRDPPIGVPLAHVMTRVVDQQLRPVPSGVPGELMLGGPGVALGYLNRAELTAERFLPSFSDVPDTRWYRTGDLVRRDCAGRLWYLGRTDRQVKLRGFRIEPAEVEALLLEVPGVRATVVEVQSDVLTAYYVAGETALDEQDLKNALSRQLPHHMVPQRWVALNAMPLGSNGKLDRNALAAEANRRVVGSLPARTPTERALVEIWKSVLLLDEVGIDANFFQIGGHSLLAASVMSRACETLGSDVPLRVLFQSPTIADLARAFDESHSGRPTL
jgi:amino acid adenylation domain-containing protein